MTQMNNFVYVLLLFLAPINLVSAQLINPTKPIQAKKATDIYDSVFRIEVATQEPNYREPWKAGGFSGGVGTGFLIGDNLIMTNAHVVSNSRRTLITKHGSAQKFKANILHIAHDCDLAVLALEEGEEALKGLQKFEFEGVPELESSVRVIGYPVGGDRMSITRGVVSRIDFRPYAHSKVDSHLVVQIDAAINPGNSGGPVLQGNKVVGVAFQGLTQADNTGYMIPTPVVNRFLKDIEDGTYDEYVELGISTFPLYNSAMREALAMAKNEQGVLVSAVVAESSAYGVLKKGDIIRSVDGYEVDPAGDVMIHGERVDMNEIVERKFMGDTVDLEVVRERKPMKLQVTLKKFPQSRIYAEKYGELPRYTIRGGLVFQPLDRNLLGAHMMSSSRVRKLFANYLSDEIFKEREDIVILTTVLKDAVNTALSDYSGNALLSVNGERVKSLSHVHQLLNPEVTPEYFVLECDGLDRPLILPGKFLKEADSRIKRQYGVDSLSNLSAK
jgi:S1-C subfamily serine protease